MLLLFFFFFFFCFDDIDTVLLASRPTGRRQPVRHVVVTFCRGLCFWLDFFFFCCCMTFTIKHHSAACLPEAPSEDKRGVLRDSASWIGLRDYPWMKRTIEGPRAEGRHVPMQFNHFPQLIPQQCPGPHRQLKFCHTQDFLCLSHLKFNVIFPLLLQLCCHHSPGLIL